MRLLDFVAFTDGPMAHCPDHVASGYVRNEPKLPKLLLHRSVVAIEE